MREIKYIVLHCTAGHQTQTKEDILKEFKDRGWKEPGYHFLIMPNGIVHNLQPIEKEANGVLGYNKNAIHISYIGGIDRVGKAVDNRTTWQVDKIIELFEQLKAKFPEAVILGHRDFSRDTNGNGKIDTWEYIKMCPCFDVRDWLNSIGREHLLVSAGVVYKLRTPMMYMDNIFIIQNALNEKGIKCSKDRWFGEETHKAVVAFQKKNKLPETGIVDKITQEKLGIKLVSPYVDNSI